VKAGQEGRLATAFFLSGLCTRTHRTSCDRGEIICLLRRSAPKQCRTQRAAAAMDQPHTDAFWNSMIRRNT
jgi:hypothetical protein